VEDSVRKLDGERYQLTDFVIMPNHIHLIASFKDEDGMLKQCESWRHFTAAKLNLVLHDEGRFWQQDGFDHLIRTTDQFDALRRYIANNPMKARLKLGGIRSFFKEFRR
jgi:putative transposase